MTRPFCRDKFIGNSVPGIVNRHIYLQIELCQFSNDQGHCVAGRQVDGEAVHLHAMGAFQASRNLCQLLCPSGDEDQVETMTGELLCKGKSYTCRSAGAAPMLPVICHGILGQLHMAS